MQSVMVAEARPPLEYRQQLPMGAATLVALSVSLITLALVVLMLRRRIASTGGCSLLVAGAVSGFLCGLALLVLLPSALVASSKHDVAPDRVLLAFISAPLAMFALHHVVLDHQRMHTHPLPPSKPLSSETPWWQQGKPCSAGCGSDCRPSIKHGLDEESSTSDESRHVLTSSYAAVLVRASAWWAHGVLDGAMLGAATSMRLLAATLVPVVFCAAQDACALVISHAAQGRQRQETLLTAMLLASGFPLGAALAASATNARTGLAAMDMGMPYLRSVTGGVFLYMAVMECAAAPSVPRLAQL